MEDLSLHILDIAENSIRADARTIAITIAKDVKNDLLRVEVVDDGKGMDPDTLAKVRDPFFTTKGKKTGLGIPLLAQAAEQSGGNVTIDSAAGRGTRLTVTFRWSHVDRPPIGSMVNTLLALIAGHPDRDFVYEERSGDAVSRFDTREVKQDLDGVPISAPAALDAIRDLLKEHTTLVEKG
jgi:anti-sigma regulatory factor (Ser/Thr protein kinase)